MLRYLVFGFLLFLPLIIYLSWAHFVSVKKEQTGGKWDDTPITRLVIVGLFLMAGGLVVSRFLHHGEAPTPLVPPQYEDDRFIRKPGEGETAEEDAPPATPTGGHENVVPGDEEFLANANRLLADFLASENARVTDRLVTRSPKWGLILRADYIRRAADGHDLPVERAIIWQAEDGIVIRLRSAEFQAPLGNFKALND